MEKGEEKEKREKRKTAERIEKSDIKINVSS